jgi:multicomponent K+:H+ antiporter subunit G
MNEAVEAVAALLALAGSLFFLAGAVGLLRLPDFYTRLHSPTKAATLGLMLLALGSILVDLSRGLEVWLTDALLIVFVLLTIPVSSQMLLRGAAARRVPQAESTTGDAPLEPIERVDEDAVL